MAHRDRRSGNGFWQSAPGAFLVGAGLFGLILFPLAYSFHAADEEWRWDVVLSSIVTVGTEARCPACGLVQSSPEDGSAHCRNPGCSGPDDGSLPAGETVVKPGQLAVGLWMTVKISVLALLMGLPLGLAGGLSRLSKNTGLRAFAACYVEVVRNTPLLVQIFVVYYVFGRVIDSFIDPQLWNAQRPFLLGALALAVFSGAYITEIVRAGILGVDVGQSEAARALGLSHFQTMQQVVLPQALKRILPPLTGQCISLIKDSSLCSVISVVELAKAGRNLVAFNFRSFEVWFTVAFLYFIVILPISLIVRRMEKKNAAD